MNIMNYLHHHSMVNETGELNYSDKEHNVIKLMVYNCYHCQFSTNVLPELKSLVASTNRDER